MVCLAIGFRKPDRPFRQHDHFPLHRTYFRPERRELLTTWRHTSLSHGHYNEFLMCSVNIKRTAPKDWSRTYVTFPRGTDKKLVMTKG